MSHNNRCGEWNCSLGEGPNPNHGGSQQSFYIKQNDQNCRIPITSQQSHEMAWRQRDSNAWQNGRSNQNNFHARNHGTNNQDFDGGFLQPPRPPKRAAKRRFRHDLPGPAGAWFQLQKQKNKRKNNNSDIIKEEEVVKLDDPENISPETARESSNQSDTKSTQIFKDYSSKLHDCNAWNLMCLTHERIVPTFQSFNNFMDNDEKEYSNAANSYKILLRTIIPKNQSLIHEIHNGQYDTHHLSPTVHTNDLCVPLLFGYVSVISCHAHSDWTATLVDESHSCGRERGITCWLEEKLVKRHPGWIRPGVVWMLEGSKLALFALRDECDDDQSANCGTNDVSPSTEAARSGYTIDRMILVGEESLVYAWTPEEASEFITDDSFKDLFERRCNVDFENGEEMKLRTKNDLEGGELVQHASPPLDIARPKNGKTNGSFHTHSTIIGSSRKSVGTNAVRQVISPALLQMDDDITEHPSQSHKDNTSRNDFARNKSLDRDGVKLDTTSTSTPSESRKEHTVLNARQHMFTDLQNASKCKTENLPLVESESNVEQKMQVQSQKHDSANNGTTRNRNAVVSNSSITSKKSTQSTMNIGTSIVSVLSAKLSAREKSIGPLSCEYPSIGTLQSSKNAPPVSCNTSPFAIGDGNEYKKVATPESFRSDNEMVAPSTVDSIDTSLDVDDDQLLYTTNSGKSFQEKQNPASNESLQGRVEKKKVNFTAQILPPQQPCNVSASSQNNNVTGKSTRLLPIQYPPTSDSFDDSLDINEEELFYTSNRPKNGLQSPPPAAMCITVNNVENSLTGVSEQGAKGSQLCYISTVATRQKNSVDDDIQTSGPNYDDVDLDSLGEEDL